LLHNFKDKYTEFEIDELSEKDFKLATHTIKGLSASIGAVSLNLMAQKLDTTQNKELLDEFYKELNMVIQELEKKLLKSIKKDKPKKELTQELRDQLFKSLRDAVSTSRVLECKAMIEKIESYKLNDKDNTLFEEIKPLLSKYKFKDAIILMNKENK